ncbi:Phosphoenolpyruvate--glycerone phosphotransferase [Lentibacillus sp. JNUCC-1]|uniref:dihydroxyacetone kinase phosphoryl donor subunit DhaM n=1 Tax=Lentibacillus sp. JNUCC-1 TaxID=2654513 RepID=UPI0012E8AE0B|nr:dihydroxyacetone kinase phosphoryl donor subunit DhaM [Lentibacillus sp. JNUCC-1]MUV36819.1 Phosphoenolpyruvate--glycerone phosphotransferase [Lentibacillus sp. JNUCC-1]
MANPTYGVLIVSHVPDMAQGLVSLLKEVAGDVPITFSAGTDDGAIGSSYTRIQQAIEDNPAQEVFAFYDLGSAKMNIEMAMDLNTSDKTIHLMDTAFVEGAYTAAALLQGDSDYDRVMSQLNPLIIK